MDRDDRNVIALAVSIIGVILFFSIGNLWFAGSIIILVTSIGFSFAIIAGGEREERIRQMKERIEKLEAQKEKEK